jgi:antibiotic biosynthesis monooxygenase (ABM) superfamily enzyme
MKALAISLFTALLLAFGTNAGSAQTEITPHTVLHVVTVKWKADATPKQIQAALDGVKALPATYKGVLRVWIRSIKVQGDKANAFVMEFADEAALKAYADSPAQKEWYKVYIPIREESTTFDITN